MNNNNTHRLLKRHPSRPLLTQKMDDFCLNYVRLGNATESARLAGYKGNENALAAASSRLLRNVKVDARIAELRKRAEDATIAGVIERKQILSEIARGRVGHYVGKNNRIQIDGAGADLKSAAVQEITTNEISAGRSEDAAIITVTKLKLRDPVSAIAELNKMEKIYSDVTNVNVDNRTLNIIVDSQETADKLKRLNERKQLYAGVNQDVESLPGNP